MDGLRLFIKISIFGMKYERSQIDILLIFHKNPEIIVEGNFFHSFIMGLAIVFDLL